MRFRAKHFGIFRPRTQINHDTMRFETIAIHAGMDRHSGQNNSIVPPIEPSTIYEHRKDGAHPDDRKYIRLSNPNRDQLEQVLTALEGGDAAAAFSSGIAAIGSVFQAVDAGSHVLLPDDLYHGTRVLIHEFAERWSLDAEFIDMRNTDTIASALKPNTRLIWVETPSNPLFSITSVQAAADLAHEHGALLAADNTWPTPFNMNPLKLGADLVVHSTTKYLGGHSDLLGGAVIAAKQDEFFERIRTIQTKQGAVPSPHDCWLMCRSIRSFPYRMRAHNEHAAIIAAFLGEHKAVEEVYYPGFVYHPGHEIAKKEMNGFGGMISFLIDGGGQDALKVVAGSKIIRRATSLGGIESTWEHRRSSEGEGSHTPENLIRLSVGLEHPDDLKEDLDAALESIDA